MVAPPIRAHLAGDGGHRGHDDDDVIVHVEVVEHGHEEDDAGPLDTCLQHGRLSTIISVTMNKKFKIIRIIKIIRITRDCSKKS